MHKKKNNLIKGYVCAIVYNKIIEAGWMFDLLDQIEMNKGRHT